MLLLSAESMIFGVFNIKSDNFSTRLNQLNHPCFIVLTKQKNAQKAWTEARGF